MKTTETFDSSGLFDDEDMDDLFADSPKRGAPSQGEHSFVSSPLKNEGGIDDLGDARRGEAEPATAAGADVSDRTSSPTSHGNSPDLLEDWDEEEVEVSGSSYDEFEDENLDDDDALAAMLDGGNTKTSESNNRTALRNHRSPSSESPFSGEAVHEMTPSPPPMAIEEDVEGDPDAVYVSEEEIIPRRA